MNKRMLHCGLLIFSAFLSAPSMASETTGKISIIRSVNPGLNAAGEQLPGRTAVFLDAVQTDCAATGWYVFQNNDSGIGKVMTTFLLTAYSMGKDVRIVGDGVCHVYEDIPSANLEGIKVVELQN